MLIIGARGIKESLLETIGNTPLVRLNNISENPGTKIYAKLEFMNPGGSVKDRTALFMIDDAEKRGVLKKNGTIIEPTAGNTGIGLALVAAQKGYKTIFVVPERFSLEKQTLMRALGAEIINTPTQEGMEGAIRKASSLSSQIENSFMPQQFSNGANVLAHYTTTGPEIYEQTEGNIDVFIAGVGTGGTFTGVSKFLKEKDKDILCIAVEPEGSILGNSKPRAHKIEGIGIDNLDTPKILDRTLIDRIYTVKDEEAHGMVKLLAEREGILAGSSSGAAAYAAYQISKEMQDKNIVVIFPDSSERYLTKNIYGKFDEWKR